MGGAGSMVGAMIGGIMAIVACSMFYLFVNTGGADFQSLWDMLDGIPDEYLYLWLIPVGAVLAIVLAIIAYAAQSKGAAYVVGLLGLALMLLPLLYAVHLSSDIGVPIQDVFFQSSNSVVSEGEWYMFLGGFMCMFDGLVILISGFGMAKKIGKAETPIYPQQYYR
jgi:hypothetical protein